MAPSTALLGVALCITGNNEQPTSCYAQLVLYLTHRLGRPSGNTCISLGLNVQK